MRRKRNTILGWFSSQDSSLSERGNKITASCCGDSVCPKRRIQTLGLAGRPEAHLLTSRDCHPRSNLRNPIDCLSRSTSRTFGLYQMAELLIGKQKVPID